MSGDKHSLAAVYEGWEGYNTSLIHAVEALTSDQLAFRAFDGMRSVGEIAAHIAFGRIDWFARMDAPHSADLAREAATVSQKAIARDAAQIARWLEDTWKMIDATLNAWTVDDLDITYEHEYWGNVYAISRQWTLWRIIPRHSARRAVVGAAVDAGNQSARANRPRRAFDGAAPCEEGIGYVRST